MGRTRRAVALITGAGAGKPGRVVRAALGRWRVVLDWRTCIGHDTAVWNLELLKTALKARGWRCVGLYEKEEFRYPVPLLWVYASGVADDIGAVVTVRATPGGAWGYFETGLRRGWFLAPCGDAEVAVDRLDRLLKYRLYPNIEWTTPC